MMLQRKQPILFCALGSLAFGGEIGLMELELHSELCIGLEPTF